MKYLKTEKITENHYKLFFKNYTYLGDLIKDVDGYFYFRPELTEGGLWSGYVLKETVSILDDLNAEWDRHLNYISRRWN